MPSVENTPERATEQHYARLAEHRAAGWDIDSRRDGIALYSALKRNGTSIVYVVAASVVALVRKLDEITQAEQVPPEIEQAARDAARHARERAECEQGPGESRC